MAFKQGRLNKTFSPTLTSLFLASYLSPLSLHAEAIQADRPGFSTGTYTVQPGVRHIEMGVQYDYADHLDEANSYTAPLLNFRMGINTETELNILWDGWSRESSGSQKKTVTSDMMLGIKQRLLSTDDYNISWLGYISLPVGNAPNTGRFSPLIALLWDYNLTDTVSAFGTVQFVSFVEDKKRSNNFQPAVGLSFSHTDKISTYIEYYTDLSLNRGTPQINLFDAGITYLLNDDIQLDFNFAVSTDRRSSDALGLGIAVRF
jgi:hypothetical protein